MSVIVKHPGSGEIILYCKGADSAIFSRLAPIGMLKYSYKTNLLKN